MLLWLLHSTQVEPPAHGLHQLQAQLVHQAGCMHLHMLAHRDKLVGGSWVAAEALPFDEIQPQQPQGLCRKATTLQWLAGSSVGGKPEV